MELTGPYPNDEPRCAANRPSGPLAAPQRWKTIAFAECGGSVTTTELDASASC